MNYAEIEISGKKIGLHFGLPAIAAISKDIQLLEGTNEVTLNMGSIVSVLLAGYENNCMIERIRPILKYRDFYEYVEQEMFKGVIPEQVLEAINVFGSSKLVSNLSKNGVQVDEKKN